MLHLLVESAEFYQLKIPEKNERKNLSLLIRTNKCDSVTLIQNSM